MDMAGKKMRKMKEINNFLQQYCLIFVLTIKRGNDIMIQLSAICGAVLFVRAVHGQRPADTKGERSCRKQEKRCAWLQECGRYSA